MSEQLKTISAMNKLYIGNLPIEADEAAVRQLFAEHNLTVADISVKRGGYAFVDFPDQSAADRAIDKLHGFSYCGLPLIVEPSVANKKIVNVGNLQSASTTQLKESNSESPTGGWRFLATGNSFKSLAFNFRLGESTIRTIVYETCSAIFEKLSPIVMPPPDESKWKDIELQFRLKWNFPHCIGALDGKHVLIEAPPNSGSLYYCYKKVFSIVLLALVDADYRFIIVDVGGLGKNSDTNIFKNSNFGKAFFNGRLHLPADDFLPGTNLRMPYVIVGDEAFPLNKHLMRPYPGNQLNNDNEKKVFNYRLSRARRVSENAFGILVRRFRIYERRMPMLPNHVNLVVLVTCCLHNFLVTDKCHWDEEDLEKNVTTTEAIQHLPHTGFHAAQEAVRIRENFIKYFLSRTGSVEWQWANITRGMQRNSI